MSEAERDEGLKEPYKLPEKFASATVHFLYGLSESGSYNSVSQYLKDKKYAFIADLISEGFKPEQIEEAVNTPDEIKVAPVFKARVTDMFWTSEAEDELDRLADVAKEQCGGDGTNGNSPAFGDVVSLGGVLESQQLALVAITYAANKGTILETSMDRQMGAGPVFTSKDSPLVRIFFPEKV